MIEVSTFFTALLTSSIVIGAATFISKRWVERAIDARFKALEEQNKAQLSEAFRREAESYDAIRPALMTALEIVYRVRNITRDLANRPSDSTTSEGRERLSILAGYAGTLSEILVKHRAVIPRSVFRSLHEIKTPTQTFMVIIDDYRRARHKGAGFDELKQVGKELKSIYELLDALYEALVRQIHCVLGTSHLDKQFDENSTPD